MKKKLMVTFILVAMAVSMIPIGAYAANIELYAPGSPSIDGVTKMDASTYTITGSDTVTLMENYSGTTITVPAGATFTVPSGVTADTVTNAGTMIANGKVNTLTNTGTLTVNSTGSVGNLTTSNYADVIGSAGVITNSGTVNVKGTATTLSNTGTANVSSNVATLTNNGGTTNLSAGTVTSYTNASGAKIVMTGGTITNGQNSGNMNISGGTVAKTTNNAGGRMDFTGDFVGTSIDNSGNVQHGSTIAAGKITNQKGATEDADTACTLCGVMLPKAGSHATGCPNTPCSCGGTLGAHATGCIYSGTKYKFYYQKKDTTTWVGTDDMNVAMKQGEGTKVKLGQDVTTSDGPLTTSNYSIELILDGHNVYSLIANSGSVTINDASGKIDTAVGNLKIIDGVFGTVSGVGNGNITGGTFDVAPVAGMYDTTKYEAKFDGTVYKVIPLTSTASKGTTYLNINSNVQVLDASNTTGISTTDASLATIWKDVKSVLEAFAADGTTLSVGGATGVLLTNNAYSMTQPNILKTLKDGTTPVSIVLRKEDLTTAAAGFDYQHIKAKLSPGYSVAALYDISIICYFNGTPFMMLTRTTSDIDINLGIASALRAAGRRYDVIGVHNDNYGSYYYDQNYFFAQSMNAGTTSYHTVHFKTNFFSTYALVAQGGNFNVPVTADSNNTTLWVTLLCVSGMCGACAIYLRRRKAKVY